MFTKPSLSSVGSICLGLAAIQRELQQGQSPNELKISNFDWGKKLTNRY
jgi:hypothetical protein